MAKTIADLAVVMTYDGGGLALGEMAAPAAALGGLGAAATSLARAASPALASQLDDAWADAKASMGQAFIPVLKEAVPLMRLAADVVATLSAVAKPFIANFVQPIKEGIDDVIAIGKSLGLKSSVGAGGRSASFMGADAYANAAYGSGAAVFAGQGAVAHAGRAGSSTTEAFAEEASILADLSWLGEEAARIAKKKLELTKEQNELWATIRDNMRRGLWGHEMLLRAGARTIAGSGIGQAVGAGLNGAYSKTKRDIALLRN